MKAIQALLVKEWLYRRAYPLVMVNLAISPFFIVSPFLFVAKPYPEGLQASVAIGLIVWHWLSMFFWGVGYGVRDEIEEGVMESLMATPAPLWKLLIAKTLDTLLINAYITASLFVLFRVFAGIPFALDWGMFMLVFVASAFSLSALSVVYAGVVILARQAAVIGNMAQEAIGILSGMTAPVSVLPRAVQWLSAIIPLTYAIEGARKTLTNESPWFEIGLLALFGIALFAVGFLLVHIAEHHIRKAGTTGEY